MLLAYLSPVTLALLFSALGAMNVFKIHARIQNESKNEQTRTNQNG